MSEALAHASPTLSLSAAYARSCASMRGPLTPLVPPRNAAGVAAGLQALCASARSFLGPGPTFKAVIDAGQWQGGKAQADKAVACPSARNSPPAALGWHPQSELYLEPVGCTCVV